MSINTWAAVGNVAAEPKQVSDKLLTFPIAVNDWDKAAGKEVPSFIDCKLLGDRASSLGRLLAKGMRVTVQGRIKQESWETPQGEKRSKIVCIVGDIQLPPKSEGASSAPASQPDDDSEVPFHHIAPQSFSRAGHVRYEGGAL